jgi:hypothetical protein
MRPPAQADAGIHRKVVEAGIENIAADVLEDHVDALRRSRRDLCRELVHVLAAVVDGDVEAVALHQPLALLGPPAMPMTLLAPLILAIWPTSEPTAPAAPVTSTTSPGCGRHTSR